MPLLPQSANVLVSSEWACKIADFGTARLAQLSQGAKANFDDAYMTRNVGTLLWFVRVRAADWSCFY